MPRPVPVPPPGSIRPNPDPSDSLPPSTHPPHHTALFAYVLYPNRHNLHLEQFAPGPEDGLPYVRNLLRYWIFSAYYIVSELWGSVSSAEPCMYVDGHERPAGRIIASSC